jgi:hypothetical protein
MIKHDSQKVRWDLVPLEVIEVAAKILTIGLDKYPEENWKTVPEPDDRYTAALLRHLTLHRSGQLLDDESGEPHLFHVLTNAIFLAWHYMNQNTPDTLQNDQEGAYHKKTHKGTDIGDRGSIPYCDDYYYIWMHT